MRTSHRVRFGYRPTVAINCLECGVATVSYVDARCNACRVAARRRVADPTCATCSTSFERKGARDRYCSDGCKPTNTRGGHATLAYRLALAHGEPINHGVVFDRDRWVCQLCNSAVDPALRWPHPASASLDHVIPISRGGAHTYANVQLAHLGCNGRKGARVASAA